MKRLWDEGTRAAHRRKVMLSGSAPLLVERDLTEGLAGRFERAPPAALELLRNAGGLRLVPGGVPVRRRISGHRVVDPAAGTVSPVHPRLLIETAIARDVLLLSVPQTFLR